MREITTHLRGMLIAAVYLTSAAIVGSIVAVLIIGVPDAPAPRQVVTVERFADHGPCAVWDGTGWQSAECPRWGGPQ